MLTTSAESACHAIPTWQMRRPLSPSTGVIVGRSPHTPTPRGRATGQRTVPARTLVRSYRLLAFLTIGFLPLLVYVYDLAAPGDVDDAFLWREIMTGVASAVVGGMKSRFVEQAWWRSALETVAVGASRRRSRTRPGRSSKAWHEGCRPAVQPRYG
jgi:hypothetical protein